MAEGDIAKNGGEIIFDEMDVFERRDEIEEQFELWVKLRLSGRDDYSEEEVKDLIRKFVPIDRISRLEKLSPNVFIMKLKDAGLREAIIRAEQFPIDDTVVWILPKHNREVRGKICYLPYQIPNELLCKALSDLGEFTMLEEMDQVPFSNDCIKSDVRYFCFRLNPKKTVKDLPYWFLCGEHRGHIRTISRRPQCNHCKQEGHTKKDCEAFKKKLASYSERQPKGEKRNGRGKRYRPMEITGEVDDPGVKPPESSEGKDIREVDVSQLQEFAANAIETLNVTQESLNAWIERSVAVLQEILKKKRDMQEKSA